MMEHILTLVAEGVMRGGPGPGTVTPVPAGRAVAPVRPASSWPAIRGLVASACSGLQLLPRWQMRVRRRSPGTRSQKRTRRRRRRRSLQLITSPWATGVQMAHDQEAAAFRFTTLFLAWAIEAIWFFWLGRWRATEAVAWALAGHYERRGGSWTGVTLWK